MTNSFAAVVIDKQDGDGDKKGGKTSAELRNLTLADLPDNDVLVEIDYSSLNYKDGLAITGKTPIARRFPMVAGIDLAGTVRESSNDRFKPGDRVLVNGWGLSERHWGGYAGFGRYRADWLVPVPDAFTNLEAMAIGTAGYTAMLCVMALEDAGVTPGQGEILVTGAGGGVGSVAVTLLKTLGYSVAASTGRAETHDYLRDLGASRIVDRAELSAEAGPLQEERWAGAVDTVGSRTLANVLAQTRYGGAVAACGLAGGGDLPASVYPFILRNVRLLGVDSVMCPVPRREAAWNRLARDLDRDQLRAMTSLEPMSRFKELAEAIIAGQTRGRVVIDVRS